MFAATGAWLLPLMAAILHPLMGWCVQRATRHGASQAVMVGISNVLTVAIFLAWFRTPLPVPSSGLDWLAVFAGVLFFFGQWFSILSVRSGDIAVHSSAMGVKVLIVAGMSLAVGLESASWQLLASAVLACLAVYLVAGGSWAGWMQHRKTVWLTVVATTFFAANDFLTGWKAQSIGVARFLVLMMLCSAVMSAFLLVQKRAKLIELGRLPMARNMVITVGVIMGIQALLVTIAFGEYQQPTLSNVAYSTRGVLAVVFLWLLGTRERGGLLVKQLVGSVVMTAALAIAWV